MAILAAKTSTRAGINTDLVAANGGGDSFVNTGVEMILIKNGDSGAHTVTIVTDATVDGLDVVDRAVAIPAGETWLIGPFPADVYNDDNNRVQLTYSAVTAVTIAIVKKGA